MCCYNSNKLEFIVKYYMFYYKNLDLIKTFIFVTIYVKSVTIILLSLINLQFSDKKIIPKYVRC